MLPVPGFPALDVRQHPRAARLALQEDRDCEAEVGPEARIAEAIRVLAEDENAERLQFAKEVATPNGTVAASSKAPAAGERETVAAG